MKVICIICEGPTEARFVKTILRPYFYSKNGTIITPITLTTSPSTNIAHKGGAINFDRDLKEIELIIKENPNPELIDDSEETHPAKRLLRIVRGYRKKVFDKDSRLGYYLLSIFDYGTREK